MVMATTITVGVVGGVVRALPNNAPLAGATVSVDGKSAVSNASGQFLINGVRPGPQVVTATKSGFQGATQTVTVPSGGHSVMANLLVLRPTVAAPTTGYIQGSVRSSQGNAPVAGALVAWGGGIASNVSTTTDANGNYRLNNVPAGTQALTVSRSGFGVSSQNVSVRAGAGTTANFILNPVAGATTGSIGGVVRALPNNAPLAGATVTVGSLSTVTNASGGFLLSNVPSGSRTVTASKSGYSSATQTVTVPSGGHSVMANNLVLRPTTVAPPSSGPSLVAVMVSSVTSARVGSGIDFSFRVAGGRSPYQYYVDLGNGYNSGWVSSSLIRANFAVVGVYRATGRVRDSAGVIVEAGSISIEVTQATVTPPPNPPGTPPGQPAGPPGSLAGTLTVSPDGTIVGGNVQIAVFPSGGRAPYRYMYYYGDGQRTSDWIADNPHLYRYNAPGRFTVAADIIDADSRVFRTNGVQIAIQEPGRPLLPTNQNAVPAGYGPATYDPTYGAVPTYNTPTSDSLSVSGISSGVQGTLQKYAVPIILVGAGALFFGGKKRR